MSGSLFAFDVGNSRTKCALFDLTKRVEGGLPEPTSTWVCLTEEIVRGTAAEFFAHLPGDAQSVVSGVNDSATRSLCDRLSDSIPNGNCNRIKTSQVPLRSSSKGPNTTGVDRLLAAFAALLLSKGSAAIVVDVGTAITVDLVQEGIFCGGAILPGPVTSLKALASATAALPMVDPQEEQPKLLSSVGTCTEEAIRAGVMWGAVGAIELLSRRAAMQSSGEPTFYLTGGGADLLWPLLAREDESQGGEEALHWKRQPNLVLAGLAITAVRNRGGEE